MLKVININNNKCAEIYCNTLLEPTFNIICICGESMLDYAEFAQHFYSKHLKNATKKDRKNEEGVEKETEKEEPEEQHDCLKEPLLVPHSTSFTQSEEDDRLSTILTTGSVKEIPSKRTTHKPNICTYCGRTFKRRYLLETHLNIHTGRKPHQCEMCGKQFRAVSTLTRHLRTHQVRKQQQCKHCDKLFTHRSALLSHELRHTQKRCFKCSSCHKSFYTRNQMDTHQRKLHQDISTDISSDNTVNNTTTLILPFECKLCSKSYRTASMLSTHRLKKHFRLAKYFCEHCDKKFLDDKSLQQHQLIHIKPEIP